MSLIGIYKALADESRLRLMRVLVHGPYSVAELQKILDMGQSRVSRHLRLLVEAGLARCRREGTWAYYEANRETENQEIATQLDFLSLYMNDLPEVDQDESRRLECLELRRQRSREFHDRVAPKWSRLRAELFGNGAVIDEVVALAAGASTVADLGCGGGELLIRLGERGRKIIGIDSSPAMLEQARSRIASSSAGERIELRLGALEHLPLADGEVDVALMNMVLHHLADPPAVLKEVLRALGTGGRLVICDLDHHENEWMRQEYGDQWLGFTKPELTRFLGQAGFELTSLHKHDAPRTGIIIAVGQASKGGTR